MLRVNCPSNMMSEVYKKLPPRILTGSDNLFTRVVCSCFNLSSDNAGTYLNPPFAPWIVSILPMPSEAIISPAVVISSLRLDFAISNLEQN